MWLQNHRLATPVLDGSLKNDNMEEHYHCFINIVVLCDPRQDQVPYKRSMLQIQTK